MMELQRDQDALQGAQHAERHEQHGRNPQDGMHPVRRPPDEFDDNSEADDQKAGDQDDKDRWSVAGIGKAIIEAANIAALGKIEKTRKQLALPATRAAAAYPRKIRGYRSGIAFRGRSPAQCAAGTPAPHT